MKAKKLLAIKQAIEYMGLQNPNINELYQYASEQHPDSPISVYRDHIIDCVRKNESTLLVKRVDKQEKHMVNLEDFERELTSLINRYSLENLSNTPDFILAKVAFDAIISFTEATKTRNDWYK